MKSIYKHLEEKMQLYYCITRWLSPPTTFYLENSQVYSKGKRIVQYTSEYSSPRSSTCKHLLSLALFFSICVYLHLICVFPQKHLIVSGIISIPKYHPSMCLLCSHNPIITTEKSNDSIMSFNMQSVSIQYPQLSPRCLLRKTLHPGSNTVVFGCVLALPL